MRRLVITIVTLLVAGCGAMQLDPAWVEDRQVQVARDAKKTISVPEGMVFYDASPATRGLRFPPGTYMLEAEDQDYWYFRSPAPLEFRVFKENKLVGGRNIAGGLMFAKHFSMIPGAGYIDGDEAKKTAVWKLGQEWLRTEGKYWMKSS